MKIYINTKEAESLIFNKIILVPESRTILTKTKEIYTVSVIVEESYLIKYENHILIRLGIVDKFEIPQKEETFFKTHLKVPDGLIELVSRQDKAPSNVANQIEYESTNFTNLENEFKAVRKGLLYIYGQLTEGKLGEDYKFNALNWLNNFNKLNNLQVKLIKEIINFKHYPKLEFGEGYKPDSDQRIFWLGYYLFIQRKEDFASFDEEILGDATLWIKNLIDKTQINEIKKMIQNSPIVLEEHYEFLIGYFLAASYYEETNIGHEFNLSLLKIINDYGLGKNNDIICWAFFFQALFKDFLDYMYVIPSLNQQQFNLEQIALNFCNHEFRLETTEINLSNLKEKEAITEMLQFKEKSKIRKIEIVNYESQMDLIKNNFSEENIIRLALPFISKLIPNSYIWRNQHFSIQPKFNPSKITYYYDEKDIELKEVFDKLELKHKPLSELFSNKKKVLLGFVDSNASEGIFSVYKKLFEHTNHNFNFEKIIFINLVDEDKEYIRSIEFNQKKSERETWLNENFGKVDLLIKNKQTKSDIEIKRNLKILLSDYKIEEIELIPDNINQETLNWVFSTSDKYIIESEIENPYIFIN